MSHEEKRKERIELCIQLVKEVSGVEIGTIAAELSYKTGCSLGRAVEYIRTATGSGKIRMSGGKVFAVELKEEKNDSA